jgi:endonuclease-8
MPEGPSIFILKELIKPLCKGKTIVKASGNARIEFNQLTGKKVTDIRSWGKQLLIFTND